MVFREALFQGLGGIGILEVLVPTIMHLYEFVFGRLRTTYKLLDFIRSTIGVN